MSLNPENEQVEGIYEAIPSFHLDHSPEDSLLLKLADVYQWTTGYAETVLEDARNTLVPGTTPLFHTVPYFKVPVKKAWYGVTIAGAIAQKPFEEQLAWLDAEEAYIPFAFGKYDKAKVYDLRLQTSFNGEEVLEPFVDYLIRDNKLYLLPAFLLRSTQQHTHLHAFDIKIDLQTVERVWGAPFGIETGPLLPKYEYRNAVEAYHNVMQSKLTIREIAEAIRRATGWAEFAIEDWYSPTLDPAKGRLYEEMVISPFTFIVTLPEYLTKDKVRINVALALVDEAKESQTNYWFFVDVLRKDTMEAEDRESVASRHKKRETTHSEDERLVVISRTHVDDLFDHGRYDVRERFDMPGPFGDYFDGMMGWSVDKFIAPLNLACERLGVMKCPPDFDDVKETLDLLTDMLNVRSSRDTGIGEFAYERERLKDVLAALGMDALAEMFTGIREMRYDEASVYVRFEEADEVTSHETHGIAVASRRTERLYFDNAPLYSFDSNGQLDASTNDKPVAASELDAYTLDGEQPTDLGHDDVEKVEVTYLTFPEIPREFRREPYYSKTRIVVRPNTDGTEEFALEGSPDGTDWIEIERVTNSTVSEKIPFSHDVDSSPTRYYRVRAIAGTERSLPTLALDATVLPEE